MADANRSRPVPMIVGVLCVVGLNAAIHHRVASPTVALSQTFQDAGALWSRMVKGVSSSGRPS